MNKNKIIIIFNILLILLSGCSNNKQDNTINSLSDLKKQGTRIGVSVGTPEELAVLEDFPDADVKIYNEINIAYQDLKIDKLDAAIFDRVDMELAIESGLTGVKILDENYITNSTSIGISKVSKIENLNEKVDTFINKLKQDGTLDDMYNRWVIKGDYKMPEIDVPTDSDITLSVGTTGMMMPYNFYISDELYGYDIELAKRLAAYLGTNLEIKVYDFNAMFAASATGEIDCIMASLYYTEERAQQIYFSQPLFYVNMAALVKDENWKDYSHAKIGALTGSMFDEIVSDNLPDAEILYFNGIADEIAAIKSGKIDAVALDEPVIRNIISSDNELTMAGLHLGYFEFGYVLTKNERGNKFKKELDTFIKELEDSEELIKLQEKWFDSKDFNEVEMLDYRVLPNINGEIKVAADPYPPFILIKEDMKVGYDVEILTLFAKEYGYALTIDSVASDAILAGVQTGKYDIGLGGFNKTAEREEELYFSNPIFSGGTALLISKNNTNNSINFIDSLKNNFYKTFIKENRWMLFVQGIGVTLLISISSVLLGTIFGFFVYMLCRKGNLFSNKVAELFVWLINGMPTVVLLMVFYYIVFGSVKISGIVVSIIAFTLVFASGVFNLLKMGVGTINIGQKEAAYALGFSDIETFYSIILPQTLPHILPSYKGEISSIIKATSIVGYVAVQDVTKMADIVRSRTYEAFFPLIAVTIIYFILASLLTKIIDAIDLNISPTKLINKELFKNVNTEKYHNK